MGIGPILILDKSVFQSLNLAEHQVLDQLFKLVLTPVLGFEIISDLLRKPPKTKVQRSPSANVQQLAEKLIGSGPTVPVGFREACVGNLMGNRVSMTGQIPIAHGELQKLPDGGHALIVGLHPLNEAVLRWRSGDFVPLEKELAARWKAATGKIRHEQFRQRLFKERVVLSRVTSRAMLRGAVDQALDHPSHQRIWIEWLLDEVSVPPSTSSMLLGRWRAQGRPFLRDYAPYAAYCVKSMLALDIAVRSGFAAWDKNHTIDLQYLFYLPFCMVFSSSDHLHATLSPVLMRANQDFIEGRTLKLELGRLVQGGLGIRALRPEKDANERHSRFVESAPTIAALHSAHLGGGPKSIRLVDSLD